LKEDAEKVLSWADRNHLRLNVTKTKLMLLGRKKREEELNRMHESHHGRAGDSEKQVGEVSWRCSGRLTNMEGAD